MLDLTENSSKPVAAMNIVAVIAGTVSYHSADKLEESETERKKLEKESTLMKGGSRV